MTVGAVDQHRRAAVIGSPIAHSLSPTLHRAAYRALGLDWTYDAIEVTADALAAFVAGRDDTWVGLSLTMPLKEAVLPLLASVDPLARRLRSVNTMLRRPDGGWDGTNTDVDGVERALRAAGATVLGTSATGPTASATVLGAGATARSAIAALARLGCTDVVVCARRPAAAAEVAALAADLGIGRTAYRDLDVDRALLDVDVVVSTLPGAAGAPWAAAAADSAGRVLLDAAYHPWPTPLVSAWPTNQIASGRDMLLWQAVRQVELMTGRTAPVEAMSLALEAA